jgi:hypothetical protein
MQAAFAAAASNASLTPLEFMLGIMKDTTVLPQLRLKAAEAAASPCRFFRRAQWCRGRGT